MPTKCTARIEKGISFYGFVMACAREMGAGQTMRGEPNDTPIPETFEPSKVHLEQIDKAVKRLAVLEKMTKTMAASRANKAYLQEIKFQKERIRKSNKLKQKYEAMLSQIQQWQPPTKGHVEFKRFMIEQVRSTIMFDCDTGYHIRKAAENKLLTGDEWLAKETETAKHNIKYHIKENKEEVERSEGRTRWMKALRESLNQKGEQHGEYTSSTR